MKSTYFLVFEVTDECDWELYTFARGQHCSNSGRFALTQRTNPDFHEAHLCFPHGAVVLATLETVHGNGGQVSDGF